MHTCAQAELLEALSNVARAQTLGSRRGKAFCERLGFLCRQSHEMLFSFGMVCMYVCMYAYMYVCNPFMLGVPMPLKSRDIVFIQNGVYVCMYVRIYVCM